MADNLWKTCDALAPPLLNPLRAILAMLAVVFLPHAVRAPLVVMSKGYYDNLNPRDQLDKAPASAMTKMAKRATAAHQNNWEAFAYFAASCLTAHVCQLDQHVASSLCTLFIAFRVAFTLLYIFGVNQAVGVARSLICVAGLIVSIRLTLLALEKQGL